MNEFRGHDYKDYIPMGLPGCTKQERKTVAKYRDELAKIKKEYDNLTLQPYKSIFNR